MILNIHTFLDNCCCSVAKSCLTLHNHVDCSMPSLPVPHHLPEFAQVHIHCVGDIIHISSSVILFSCLQSFPASVSFLKSQLFASGGQSIAASGSASVLPKSIQGWLPLVNWLVWSCFPRDSQETLKALLSSTTVWKHQFFSTLPSYCPALTSIHDYQKDHSLDYRELFQQNDVFYF